MFYKKENFRKKYLFFLQKNILDVGPLFNVFFSVFFMYNTLFAFSAE